MNKKPLNFIPLHDIQHVNPMFKKKKFEYTLKKVVPNNFRSSFRSSVKNRNEYNDYDYLDKLNPKEKEWLYKFHREYLNADLKHKGKVLFKKKYHKSLFYMNNCRNRDLFSREKVKRNLVYLGDNVFKLIDKGEHF